MLSVKDLQQKLNIGRDTAYALMHSKNFPSFKLGGRYFVTQQALDKWLEQNAYKTVRL